MKKLLVLLGFFALIITATKAQNIEEIDGIFYKNSEIFTGTYINFYTENQIKSEVKIRKGEKHGKTNIYFENGNLNEIRSYKHNAMHGKWTMFNEHGIKVSIARYKNGNKHGKWTIWNDYGNLLYELEYANGKKAGVWKKYDEQGKLISERKY
jgi:antitoxin component YwqK of YwqJK toxin-antitoxin module